MPTKLRKYAPGSGPLSPARIAKLRATFSNADEDNRREWTLVARWCRSLRVRNGLTRQQCARRGRLHVSRVQLIEEVGEIRGLANYERLGIALGLPPPQFVDSLYRALCAH
jgi:hypothetical protein